MRNRAFAVLFVVFLSSPLLADSLDRWVVGVGLGELPSHGSFKPSATAAYRWSERTSLGLTYQIGDSIRRNSGSFNATGFGLEGLVSSDEEVGPRAMAALRWRPRRWAPFVTLGVVFNGRDTETSSYRDGTVVVQSRAPALRPAVGLGYEFAIKRRFSVHVEWAGWVFAVPTPEVRITGGDRSAAAEEALQARVVRNFRDQITNSYHVFSVGVGYSF